MLFKNLEESEKVTILHFIEQCTVQTRCLRSKKESNDLGLSPAKPAGQWSSPSLCVKTFTVSPIVWVFLQNLRRVIKDLGRAGPATCAVLS